MSDSTGCDHQRNPIETNYTPDEWKYINLMNSIDWDIDRCERKIEILKEMKELIPKGKTKRFYDVVFGTKVLSKR